MVLRVLAMNRSGELGGNAGLPSFGGHRNADMSQTVIDGNDHSGCELSASGLGSFKNYGSRFITTA